MDNFDVDRGAAHSGTRLRRTLRRRHGPAPGVDPPTREHISPANPHPEGQGIAPAQPAFRRREETSAWLEGLLAATELISWAKLICFAHVPSLARCEIAALRYRVLRAAAQFVRQGHLAQGASGAG